METLYRLSYRGIQATSSTPGDASRKIHAPRLRAEIRVSFPSSRARLQQVDLHRRRVLVTPVTHMASGTLVNVPDQSARTPQLDIASHCGDIQSPERDASSKMHPVRQGAGRSRWLQGLQMASPRHLLPAFPG